MHSAVLPLFLTFFLLVCLPIEALAARGTTPIQVEIPSLPAGTELILRLRYRLDCPLQDVTRFPGITGVVHHQGRTIRFELFQYLDTQEISLGMDDSPAGSRALQVQLEEVPACSILRFDADVPLPAEVSSNAQDPLQALALRHSPFIGIRPDQFKDPHTDLPVQLTWRRRALDHEGFAITYTAHFTDEDVHGFLSTSRERSIGTYGRRTDIEWVYEVSFDRNERVIRRRYQGGIFHGLGHKTHDFKGSFLEGTEHPVLYDIAAHNVFGDRPISLSQRRHLTGHHLVPNQEPSDPEAREWWQWRNPWIFKVSDLELKREGRLSRPSTEYLFLLLEGQKGHGGLTADVLFDDGGEFMSGKTHASRKRYPINWQGSQAFTGLPVGSDRLNAIGTGDARGRGVIRFLATEGMMPELDLERVRAFRLRASGETYQVEEISDALDCVQAGNESRCFF